MSASSMPSAAVAEAGEHPPDAAGAEAAKRIVEAAAAEFGRAAGVATIPPVRRRVKGVLRAQEPGAMRRLEKTDPIVKAVLVALIGLNDLPVSGVVV